jgi:dTDP-4-amino-4,6-dideoxygalactose transaminase
MALDVRAGDEVVTTPFTFFATAGSVARLGALPRFVDIDPRTYNIDPSLIEAAITPRTRAIVPVDQIGLAADLPAIHAVARRHGLAVIEDAAPSLGATVGEVRVGMASDFTCFSFHPRKSITTGEGGLVATNDARAAERLRRSRSHGASTSDLARHQSGTIDFEEYAELGFNYRMTDIQAAIGLVQLSKLEVILAERRRLAERYTRLLASEAQLQTPFEPRGYRHTYQSYCVWLHTSRSRAAIMAELARQGVASRRGVMAIHLEPLYRALTPDVHLPVTERAATETLLLPLYAGMTDAEQDTVVAALRRALQ